MIIRRRRSELHELTPNNWEASCDKSRAPDDPSPAGEVESMADDETAFASAMGRSLERGTIPQASLLRERASGAETPNGILFGTIMCRSE